MLRKAAPLLLFLLVQRLQALPYPLIEELRHGNPLFMQLTDDIRLNYKAEASEDTPPALLFYGYRVGKDEDLFSVSARCSLSYDTLATLNRLGSPSLEEGTILLIPNRHGLFLISPPRSDLELLTASWQDMAKHAGTAGTAGAAGKEEKTQAVFIEYPDGTGTEALFISGARFSSLQRAYFLGILFRLPLDRSVLSSAYGMRRDPFTGGHTFHHGIDLAAPEGTPVYAARSGTVSAGGFDPVLGNYLVIDHDGGYKSVYGHLKTVNIQLKSAVRLGMIIGSVGNTGMSTGPHLHFEVRFGSEARNPQHLLPEISE
jgi:murein DD-endopeptidase MepM/ murein hydrolase activator NlpD